MIYVVAHVELDSYNDPIVKIDGYSDELDIAEEFAKHKFGLDWKNKCNVTSIESPIMIERKNNSKCILNQSDHPSRCFYYNNDSNNCMYGSSIIPTSFTRYCDKIKSGTIR